MDSVSDRNEGSIQTLSASSATSQEETEQDCRRVLETRPPKISIASYRVLECSACKWEGVGSKLT